MATESSRSGRERMSEFVVNWAASFCCAVFYSQYVEWVRAYTGAISELQAYVKSRHTTGLVWNKQVGTSELK